MIISSCIIRDRAIFKDGKRVFEDAASNLEGFLMNAYSFLDFQYPKFYKMDRLSQLGVLASELLLSGRKLANEYRPEDISLILSNASSSRDTDERYWQSVQTMASPALFVYTLPNIVSGEICIRHGLKGENAFFVSERFDADLLTEYVALVPGPVAIAGWVEVVGERHDVFLYLHEKNTATGKPANATVVQELYTTSIWNS